MKLTSNKLKIKTQPINKNQLFKKGFENLTISGKKRFWSNLSKGSPFFELLVRDAIKNAKKINYKLNPKDVLYIKHKNTIYVSGTSVIIWTDPKTKKSYVVSSNK